jgi:hypothetical protein
MRAELGPLVLVTGYCLAGMGVLAALGFVRANVLGVLAALGLGFMVGVAAVLLVAIALLCVGVSVGLGALAVLATLIAASGFTVAWRRAAPPRVRLTRPRPPSLGETRSWAAKRSLADIPRALRKIGVDRLVAGAVMVALAVFAVVTVRWARVQPLHEWDSWSIWARKGTLLFDFEHMPTAFLTSHVYAFMHSDYPLLIPLYEASWFHAVGAANTESLHVAFWILFVAFLWAAAYVGARVARPAVWAPLVGLVAVTPAIWNHLMTMYADVPMGLFLMVGVLLLGIWIGGRRHRDLALATLLLAAAASTKNEGLTAAISVLAVAVIVVLLLPATAPSRSRTLAPLGVAIAALVAILAPWRLWLAAHHVASEMPIGRGLDPSYLLSRTDRVQPAVNALFSQVGNQGNWYYLLPVGLALLIAALATRGLRSVAAFYGLATFGAGAMVLWAYVISTNELNWLILTSADRTVVGPMLIVVAGVLHLAGALTRDVKRATPEPTPDPRLRVQTSAPRRKRPRRASAVSRR